jgi:SAM-dependent methyltransferase
MHFCLAELQGHAIPFGADFLIVPASQLEEIMHFDQQAAGKRQPNGPCDAVVGNPLATPLAWNLVADAYATELVPQFEPFARDALRLAELPPQPRVVDVAAGPGTLALLAAMGGATVSAVDFSAAMIDHLRRRAAEAGLAAVDAQVGDGQALPLASDAYDGAFSMFGLMMFPDREAGFRELRRVLRPGRRAVVSSWAPVQEPFLTVMESLGALLPNLPFGRDGGPLSNPNEFSREMSAVGFRDVQIHLVSHRLFAPSTAGLWASLQRTMAPVVLLRHRLGEEQWAQMARQIFTRLQAKLGDGPVETSVAAYLGVGAK